MHKCCPFFSALERKISVRANRDELVQKGILMPESPTTPLPEPGESLYIKTKNKQTPWPLVRERTIPTDRPPLVDEI
jgi:hypothetical protein